GGYLGIALPFIVLTASRTRGRWRIAMIGLVAADLAGIVVTRSRGGLLAAAVGAAVLVIGQWRSLAVVWRAGGAGAGVGELAGGRRWRGRGHAGGRPRADGHPGTGAGVRPRQDRPVADQELRHPRPRVVGRDAGVPAPAGPGHRT